MGMNVNGGLDKVLQTLDRLQNDLENNAEEWENPTLARYLEAMRAWLADSQGKAPREPSWALISDMLDAASGYE